MTKLDEIHKAIAHRAQMRMLDFLYENHEGFKVWWDDTVKNCKDAGAIEDKLEAIIVKVLNELAPQEATRG